MLVRSLVPEDKEKIHRLMVQRGTFKEEEIRVALELVDEAICHAERGEYFFLCALDGRNSLSGYICFGPIPMTENCFDLYWIAVDERYSRQGIGSILLAEMEEFIRKRRARQVYIDTSSTPSYAAARAFYKKHGYRPVCVLNDFYRQGDHKMIFKKEV